MQKITEDIKGVYSITERNHKLETKRNMMRSKADKTMNQLPPPTPCKHTPFKGKKSRMVKWQNRLDLVQDPLEAVRLLVRKLDLVKTDEWRNHLKLHTLVIVKYSSFIFILYILHGIFFLVLTAYKHRLFYFIFEHERWWCIYAKENSFIKNFCHFLKMRKVFSVDIKNKSKL